MEFADYNKRISYAASIGMNEIPREYSERFQKAIAEYKAISVREHAAANLIETMTGRKPMVVVDPTMLLTGEEWSAIAKPIKELNNKKLIIRYCLGKGGTEADQAVEMIKAKYPDALVIDILDNQKYVIGPQEFIWLMSNAVYIITDSFHGTVFSMLYGKPFSVLKRAGNEDNIFSRLDTLLTAFNLQDHITDGTCKEIPVSEVHIDSILKKEKEKAKEFLIAALGDSLHKI